VRVWDSRVRRVGAVPKRAKRDGRQPALAGLVVADLEDAIAVDHGRRDARDEDEDEGEEQGEGADVVEEARLTHLDCNSVFSCLVAFDRCLLCLCLSTPC
jgi:hypothetical protein